MYITWLECSDVRQNILPTIDNICAGISVLRIIIFLFIERILFSLYSNGTGVGSLVRNNNTFGGTKYKCRKILEYLIYLHGIGAFIYRVTNPLMVELWPFIGLCIHNSTCGVLYFNGLLLLLSIFTIVWYTLIYNIHIINIHWYNINFWYCYKSVSYFARDHNW